MEILQVPYQLAEITHHCSVIEPLKAGISPKRRIIIYKKVYSVLMTIDMMVKLAVFNWITFTEFPSPSRDWLHMRTRSVEVMVYSPKRTHLEAGK